MRLCVFISYSHDSETHTQMVLELANRLVGDGVECVLDQYEPAPQQGWPKWMCENIESATHILIVCTHEYIKKTNREVHFGVGRGVKFESLLTYQDLYENDSLGCKFVPVVFDGNHVDYVPKPLRGFTYYNVRDASGYEALYRRLTAQPLIVKPELGARKYLPPKGNVAAPSKEIGELGKQVPDTSECESRSLIELTLDKEFDQFSTTDRVKFINALAELLSIEQSEIHIKQVRKGSVKIVIELPRKAAQNILQVHLSGGLQEWDVTDARLTTALVIPTNITGTVKWFNDAKGFGFIEPDQGGEDVFAHFSQIAGDTFRQLTEGEKVSYFLVQGPKGGLAYSITPIYSPNRTTSEIMKNDLSHASNNPSNEDSKT